MATKETNLLQQIILPLFGALITVNTSYLVYKINQLDALANRVSVIETEIKYLGGKQALLFKHEDFFTIKNKTNETAGN